MQADLLPTELSKTISGNVTSFKLCIFSHGLLWWPRSKESSAKAGDAGLNPGQEDPLEKEMATHSSILAWEILRTEEPGGLQSLGWQKSRTQVQSFHIYNICFHLCSIL